MLALQDQAAQSRDRPPAESWSAPPGPCLRFREGDDSAPLLALADEPLAARFRAWRGASGGRYVFSVYEPLDCPAYQHAVILVAAVDGAGERKARCIVDTGWFPEIVLANAATTWMGAGITIEFHVHLLANSPAGRQALIADLSHPARS